MSSFTKMAPVAIRGHSMKLGSQFSNLTAESRMSSIAAQRYAIGNTVH